MLFLTWMKGSYEQLINAEELLQLTELHSNSNAKLQGVFNLIEEKNTTLRI